MQKNRLFYVVILLLSLNVTLKAQIGFGTNIPNTSSVVDMFSANKGILIPRVKLNANNITTPIVAPPNSLLVFNTEIAGSPPNNVTPGYYYFSTISNNWVKLSDDPTWDIDGNAGTNAATNFIGTKDDQDLVFNVSNVRSGLLNSSLKNTSYGIYALNLANTNSNTTPASTGTDNVAVGFQTLQNNTTGSYNTASGGAETLGSNIEGSGNVAMGYQSLTLNTIGNYNLAVGFQALHENNGTGNVAMLTNTLYSNKNSDYNIGIGANSLAENISGNANLAIGENALQSNIAGNNNVAIGIGSLGANKNNENIAIGFLSLAGNDTGLNNTSLGFFSLLNSRIGSNNTAAGEGSLGNLGANSGSGSNNTALGTAAGGFIQNGINNTALGINTILSDHLDNQLNIGNAIFGSGLIGDVVSPKGNIGINVVLPNSTLHVAGSIANNINILSNNAIVSDKDYTILVEGNITLPTPVGCKGRIYVLINNINPNTTGFTISTQASTFKDGNNLPNNYLLTSNGTSRITVQSNDAQWQIISKF